MDIVVNARRASPAASPAPTSAVQSELLELLFRNLPRGLVVTAINTLITAYLLRSAAPVGPLVAWTLVMLAVCAVRAAMLVAYRRNKQLFDVGTWQQLFLIGALAGGLSWGSAAVFLLPPDSVSHQVFLGFVLAGMGAGAMTSLVFDRASFAAFVVAAIGPYALVMLWQGTELPVVMGALAIMFVLGILAGGETFRESIVETLRLRFENEELAADLGMKAEEQKQTNELLKVEIERASLAEEKMRRAKEQAVAASRAKSTFLANMSHEIRTPINGVLGMTDLLMRTSLDDRQKQLAQTLRSSGSMLLSIIEDVLDISRIEAGKLSIVAAPFSLLSCCEDALALLQPLANQKRLDLRLSVGADLPEAILGDADRTRQVVVNLVGNSVKFTSAGHVEVRLEKLPASDSRSDLLRISVIDTGIGIDPSELERIMQPFEQADPSINRRYGGTGLGLAISKHLVSLMGGEMHMRSSPGQGTEVAVDLPLNAIERRAVPRSGAIYSRLDGLRVLLAEDNPVNQMIAQEYLAELGCRVDTVENGREAVTAFQHVAYDIVLMDCQMPELDGLSATVELRRIEAETGRLRSPIIAVTANAFEDDREKSLAAGMDAHLSKPYTATDLEVTLLKWAVRRAAGADERSDGNDGTRGHRLIGSVTRSGNSAA